MGTLANVVVIMFMFQEIIKMKEGGRLWAIVQPEEHRNRFEWVLRWDLEYYFIYFSNFPLQ